MSFNAEERIRRFCGFPQGREAQRFAEKKKRGRQERRVFDY
jgi:hypothetical protein